MKPYYTAHGLKNLKKQMTILCTKNEQKNDHIKSYFDTKGILYKDKTLKTGDYCFMLPKNPDEGRHQDIVFTDELFIERKNSLDELAQSVISQAFRNELKRAQAMKHKYLIVEQANGWQGLVAGDYHSGYDPKAFYTTMHGFMVKYDLRVIFCDKQWCGSHIHSIASAVLEQYIEK